MQKERVETSSKERFTPRLYSFVSVFQLLELRQNHTMIWVGGDLKDQLDPTPLEQSIKPGVCSPSEPNHSTSCHQTACHLLDQGVTLFFEVHRTDTVSYHTSLHPLDLCLCVTQIPAWSDSYSPPHFLLL